MTFLCRLFIFISLVFTPVAAMGQAPLPGTLEPGQSAIVTAVEPYLSLKLDDGRTLRLSAVETPDSAWQDRAAEWLKTHINGQQVIPHMYPEGAYGRTDRYGRSLAQVTTADTGLWLQQALLQAGLVRVRALADDAGIVPVLYGFEAEARDNKRGLWSDPRFGLKDAQSVHDHLYSEQIVEDTVLEAKQVRGRIYLNFGTDWKTDFTVTITKGDLRKFTKAGQNPLEWAGRKIRVRGWVKSYNGPMIEVTHPVQIELPGPATSYNPG